MKILFVFECKGTIFILYMQIFFKKNALFVCFFLFFAQNRYFRTQNTTKIVKNHHPFSTNSPLSVAAVAEVIFT